VKNGSVTSSEDSAAPEQVARLVRDLLDTWNAHDLGRIETFYAPYYEGTDVGQAGPQRGPRSVSQNLERYLRAFPDLRFVEKDVVVQGDRAVLVWEARGTHAGKLMNIPPTGRRIAVCGASVLTVEGGRISRGLYVWDVAGLLRSIGLLPEL
jgi:predicted ester cyclase